MKLTYRQIEPFVAKPDPAARVILIYGPDAGLVKERAALIGKTVVADLNDPFNVAVLTSDQIIEDPARLADEASALSMMGGDRLIRVEDAADKIVTFVKTYLENPSQYSLVLLIAGELGKNSKLRMLCEGSKNAAALPCYVDDVRDLGRIIRQTLHDGGHTIESEAVQWLAANISGDRAKVRSELEKLSIYKGEEKTPITVADAMAACGAAGAQSFDDLVFNVGGRNTEAALRAYAVLSAEGIPFVAVLRSLQNHFRRLHRVKSEVAGGEETGKAMKDLKPPVFYKVEDAFRAQLNGWSLASLDKILGRLMELEAQCKQTAMPSDTLCAQAILGISKMR
ncbi:MAG: DNA polymerase III subunit delta [Alphaproteobacteria bacterium]|nr:DNA polymerase III subunit delta [Alphaproteobacteria bacterium]